MTARRPLDPDQVACPTCHAPAGKVCRTPTGGKAKALHVARRRLAADKPSASRRPSPATPAGRRKGSPAGGRTTADKRKRDATTVRAIVGEVRATALLDRAVEIGQAAARWDARRMALKTLALDDALEAAALLGEYLEAARRVRLDPLTGRPMTVPVEETDREGRPRTVERPDARGYVTTTEIRELADTVTKLVGVVRLEEGSTTSNPGGAGDLSGISDADLAAMLDRSAAAARELGGDE